MRTREQILETILDARVISIIRLRILSHEAFRGFRPHDPSRGSNSHSRGMGESVYCWCWLWGDRRWRSLLPFGWHHTGLDSTQHCHVSWCHLGHLLGRADTCERRSNSASVAARRVRHPGRDYSCLVIDESPCLESAAWDPAKGEALCWARPSGDSPTCPREWVPMRPAGAHGRGPQALVSSSSGIPS